ncbi:MAG TPA: hypothetical protein VF473_10255 [Cyclobacteriaceae bacterium]
MANVDTTWLTATGIAVDVLMFTSIVIFVITPKAGRTEFQLLFLALLFSFLNDMAGFIGGRLLMINMNLAYTIGLIIIYPSYILFYRRQIKSKKIGQLLTLTVFFFIAFTIVNVFFIQGPGSNNSYTLSLRSTIFITISLVYFYVLIKELPAESITKLPMFWINTAVLIYYSGTFFQNLAADYMVSLKGDLITTWTIKNSLGMIYYAIICGGLWLNRSHFSRHAAPSR